MFMIQDRNQYMLALAGYKRQVLFINAWWFVGLMVLLFLTAASFGVAKATFRAGGVFLSGLILVLLNITYVQCYYWIVLRLAKKTGMLCDKCGKSLLAVKNRNSRSTGKCGFCGNSIFKE
jgi:hypothetical protein